MNQYLDAFSKIVDAGVLSYSETVRIYSVAEAKYDRNKRKKICYCIYVLFNGDEITYVGQTGYLPTRIRQHSFNWRMKFDSVMVVSLDRFGLSAHTVDEIEKSCIELFRPRMNTFWNPDYKNVGKKWIYLPDLNTRTA